MHTKFALLLLLTPALTAGEIPCRSPREFGLAIEKLHSKEWTEIDVARLEQWVGATLRDENTSTSCSDTLIVSNSEKSSCRVIAEFSSDASSKQCRRKLVRISVQTELPMPEAESLVAEVMLRVRPGGRALGSDNPDVDFLWRSDDSRVQYDLLTSAEPAATPPAPATPARVKIVLGHTPVDPNDVDELPFRKGYFPPECASSRKP